MPDVEIALVGDPDPRAHAARHDLIPAPIGEDVRRPWSKRRRISYTVSDDEALEDILDRAAADFGVVENSDWSLGWESNRFVAFRKPGSLRPLEDRLSRFLTLIDEEGRAVWKVWDFKTVSLGQIRAAAAAGAIDGDATQIYLNVRSVPAGGGVLLEWNLLTQAWDVAWRTLDDLAAIWGSYELFRALRRRLAGRHAVDRHVEEWLKRNGWPDSVKGTLDGRPWHARDLAGLLGCTTDESESILKLYGYEPGGESGRWIHAAGNVPMGTPASDPSARVLLTFTGEVIRRFTDSDVQDETLEALFREVFEETIRGD